MLVIEMNRFVFFVKIIQHCYMLTSLAFMVKRKHHGMHRLAIYMFAKKQVDYDEMMRRMRMLKRMMVRKIGHST